MITNLLVHAVPTMIAILIIVWVVNVAEVRADNMIETVNNYVHPVIHSATVVHVKPTLTCTTPGTPIFAFDVIEVRRVQLDQQMFLSAKLILIWDVVVTVSVHLDHVYKRSVPAQKIITRVIIVIMTSINALHAILI